MARSLGIPARINVGVAYVRGAFYYHAWPEVYLDEGKGRGLWLPVDPTFNQFPADATHVRLARGGLDKQTAILPLIGQAKMTVRRRRGDAELDAGPGRPAGGRHAAAVDRHSATPGLRLLGVAVRGRAADDRRRESRQALRQLHGGRRRVVERGARPDPRLSRAERRRQDHEHPHDRRAAEAQRRPHRRQRPRSRDASPKRRRPRSASFPIARSSTKS